jgi:sulfoxide reductase catalytic subunit YedY
MLIKIKRGWELPESAATPEAMFHDRRRFLKAAAAGPILAVAPSLLAACDEAPNQSAQAAVQMAAAGEPDPSAKLYPVMRNLRYRLDRDITDEELATTYNNYYEFGSSKNVWKKAQALPLRPWPPWWSWPSPCPRPSTSRWSPSAFPTLPPARRPLGTPGLTWRA